MITSNNAMQCNGDLVTDGTVQGLNPNGAGLLDVA